LQIKIMESGKTCPLCKKKFYSVVSYKSHVRNKHSKISREEIIKDVEELKELFR